MKKEIRCLLLAISIIQGTFHSMAQVKKIPPPDFDKLPVINWKFKTGAKIFSSPVMNDNVIYVGGSDSILHALDLSSGKQLWQLHTGGEIRSAVCMNAQTLFLNGGDGNLYSVDIKNGHINWTFKTGGEHRYDFADYFDSSPVIKDGIIYFGSGDSSVYAIRCDNGKMKWSYQTGGPVHNTIALDNDKLYTGSFDGYVYALNLADGKLVWKFKTVGHDYFPKGEVQGSPTVFNGMVFIGARDYNVYALDATKGYCHWNKAFTRGWGLCTDVHDSTLYIGSADERVLIAADPATGHEHWNKKMEFLVFGNNVYSQNLLYIGTTIGKIHGISLKTGDKIWSFETDAYKKNRFTYFKQNDSYRDDIYSIIKSNEEFLDAECNLGGIFSSAVISDNYIVFTSTEGIVYCLQRS